MRREAAYWIREAWYDYCTARLLFEARRWSAAAFHCHQAVEKALKSLYLVALRREPPKTYVLTELYRELRRGRGVELSPSLEEGVAELNKFYIVSRYPDAAAGQPYEVVTRRDAERSLETAGEVLTLVEGVLRSLGYEGTPGDTRDCK
ncbi:HEPN domain-containing protein [Pyrobaculum ferrireducens]|uniref:HEPN domain-containing protein n=1 Tax=Pyrobaculum ferrireducens TaxID=1104324 RepID=UPI000A90ED5D|nr:HEPN domain-containing protein [Pyrobaculum ferrireducens]